jgi:hypothetical protein
MTARATDAATARCIVCTRLVVGTTSDVRVVTMDGVLCGGCAETDDRVPRLTYGRRRRSRVA